MKRKILPIILIIICCLTLVGFSACNKDKTKPLENYGKVSGFPKATLNYAFSAEVKEAHPEYFVDYYNEGYLQAVPPKCDDSYDLCDVEFLPKSKIKYVIENPKEITNGVVTTKWVYYFHLFRQYLTYSPKDSPYIVSDEAFYKVLNDEYCMEKISVLSLALKNNPRYGVGESVPFIFGSSAANPNKKTYDVPYGTSLADTWPNIYILETLAFVGREPIISEYPDQVRAAAFARYGFLSDAKIEETDLYVTYNSGHGEFTIVGYIETEADKLLSTGVSMDEESEEYQIVMEQLQNPRLYSVCGNFLED